MRRKELDGIRLSYIMASNFIKMNGLFIGEGRAGIEGREYGGGAGVNRISGQGRYPLSPCLWCLSKEVGR